MDIEQKSDNRIHILYLHNKRQISGGERSMLNLWENLDSSRFKPYLIIPGKGDFSQETEKLGTDVSFLEIPKLSLLNFFKISRILFTLRNYARKNDIHIIHSYTPRNNILSAFVGKTLKIPVIWHERNLIFGRETDITKRFSFLPDRVICNSHAVAERFRKKGGIPPQVTVILNGVNLTRFNPAADNERIKKELGLGGGKVVGIITNFGQRKRLEYFLEAASIVSKRSSDVMFLVVGGEFSEEAAGRFERLKNRAAELGLGDRIKFTGFVKDITGFLASFDVSAHVTQKEACSRAIIESMSAGKPVVAMADGGNPELVEDGITGILTEPDDMKGFVKAIEDLLADDIKRREMGKRARERAEMLFDVKRNVRETEQIYIELMRKTCV